MADILLFHHANGLTDGVRSFAETLRAAGHTVQTPDLFEGRVFETVEEGVAFRDSVGREVLMGRAFAAVEGAPADLVYVGMSMGCMPATVLLLNRPGARGAVYLYAAVDPAWFDAEWPAGVPAQSHQTEDDPWREAEADEGFAARVPGGEAFLYPGSGHLFADSDSADFDEAAAKLATERVLAFLDRLG